MLGAEGPIGCLPLHGVLLAPELVHQDVGNGGDDRGGVLTLPELPQEIKMNTDQGIELGEQAVKEFRLHVQVGGHPLTEHLLDDLEQLTVMLLSDDELAFNSYSLFAY